MHCSKDLLGIIFLTIFSELVVTIHELEAACHSFAYKIVMVCGLVVNNNQRQDSEEAD